MVKAAARTHRAALWQALSSGSSLPPLQGLVQWVTALQVPVWHLPSQDSQVRGPRAFPLSASRGCDVPPHGPGLAGTGGSCRQYPHHQHPPRLCLAGKKPRRESRRKGVPHSKYCLKSIDVSSLLTFLSLLLLTNVYRD